MMTLHQLECSFKCFPYKIRNKRTITECFPYVPKIYSCYSKAINLLVIILASKILTMANILCSGLIQRISVPLSQLYRYSLSNWPWSNHSLNWTYTQTWGEIKGGIGCIQCLLERSGHQQKKQKSITRWMQINVPGSITVLNPK